MSEPAKILFRVFVKSFYKENFNSFLFLFTMMFFIVGNVDGAGIYEYHYSLVKGMLSSTAFLLLVFAVWFIYARKCAVFVADLISNPQYIFLQVINRLEKRRQLYLFIITAVWLLLPVLLYSVFIVYVGCDLHLYMPLMVALLYLLILLIATALGHLYLLNNFHTNYKSIFSLKNVIAGLIPSYRYYIILLRFVADKQKIIWVTIKIFTCGSLYLLALNNTDAHYDSKIVFLFFNFGVLANGIIIFRIREFEEEQLSFYHGLPVTLIKRFIQYLIVYFILLIPEFITAAILTPVHLTNDDAVSFYLCAYSIILLLNSVTFFEDLQLKEYIALFLPVFCLQYTLIILGGFVLMYIVFFILAILVFFTSWYKFERVITQ